jgi:hypothetical protein
MPIGKPVTHAEPSVLQFGVLLKKARRRARAQSRSKLEVRFCSGEHSRAPIRCAMPPPLKRAPADEFVFSSSVRAMYW